MATQTATKFTFSYEAVEAALQQATEMGYVVVAYDGGPIYAPDHRPMRSMDAEQILQAAWAAQDAGDSVISDLRATVRGLEATIDRLRQEAQAAQRVADSSRWAKLDAAELDRMYEHVTTVLQSTKRLHKRQTAFVRAWEALAEWVGYRP